MINCDLDWFLDNGRYNEATLYYNGYMYWCEGGYTKDGKFHFFVDKRKSEIVNEYYQKVVLDENGKVEAYFVLEFFANDEDEARKMFLEAKIFEGKSFWEVEKDLAYYDEQ